MGVFYSTDRNPKRASGNPLRKFGEEIKHLILGDGVVYVVTDTTLYALTE